MSDKLNSLKGILFKDITLGSSRPTDFSKIHSTTYHKTQSSSSPPSQVCFIMAFALLAIGLVIGALSHSAYMAAGGVSAFLFWGVVGLILRAVSAEADRRNDALIRAIRELKEK